MDKNFYGLGRPTAYNQNEFGSGNSAMLSPDGSNYALLSSPEFMAYAGAKGIDINSLTGAELNTMGGDFISSKVANENQGFGDLGFKDQATLGLGAVQAGLGVAGYFDDKKTAKLQRQDLSTRIASNKDLLATRKERAGDIKNTFGLGA